MKNLLFTLFFCISVSAFAKPMDRPNVLFISVDDLNDFVGFMGDSKAHTPVMDKLASSGTLFSRAYSQFPLCGPSRASVFSGLYPHHTGIFNHISDATVEKMAEQRQVRLLHEYFADHGYKTMAVGKLLHHHIPEDSVSMSGGREPFGPRLKFKWHQIGTSTDWGAYPDSNEDTPDYRSAKWAVERLKEDHESPFLLMVGFLRPHVPWYAPEEWFELHKDLSEDDLPFYNPDDLDDVPDIAVPIDANYPNYPTTEWALRNDEWINILKGYYASVSFVDYCIGVVLDALNASAYKDNTIVVLWSDHGYHLGEKGLFKKVTLWERSLHVPLIFAGPGVEKGVVVESNVGLVDILPTVTSLAGLPAQKGIDGVDLFLQSSNNGEERPVLSMCFEGNYSLIKDQYHYILYQDGSEELYNFDSDPNEWINLVGDPSMQTKLEGLRKGIPYKPNCDLKP